MDSTTAERLVANEYRFREVNERLEADVREIADPEERIAFVCECSATSCRETVSLNLDEYGALRAVEGHFAIVTGHEILEIERVVQRADRYIVVEKLLGA